MTTVAIAGTKRVRISVHGTVQGVGYRPFVYRLASSFALTGVVRNDALGVTIEAHGDSMAVDAFVAALQRESPPNAKVDRLVVVEVANSSDYASFEIEASIASDAAAPSIPADLATCDDCFGELFDPADRRHRYAFINCTNCGPRFTIARGLPYDRATTTMAQFTMCRECQAEYDDPSNRRFHAQPNACARCGPRLSIPIETVAAALRNGAIVAVKGLGGYHLACRADDADVVARLRDRKRRDEKPFAIMVHTVQAAHTLVRLDALETQLLTSAARPIVVASARDESAIAANVAPGRSELGIMLPYTPLHHLLLSDVGVPLVMTSGNVSDEPIAYQDDDARTRLSAIADVFLMHDRPIQTRCEDSVVRVIRVNGNAQPLFLRRSRGYVPHPLRIDEAAEPVLGVGAQLKNTTCLAWHGIALVGPHQGDLDDASALAAFASGVDHLTRLSGVSPTTIAHDLHPEYASTRYAFDRAQLRHTPVQHHHAHLAAVLGEFGVREAAIGVIFDGAGLGTDGTIWGGEILVGDAGDFERAAHLRPVALPGGDAAVREPWRMACAWLTEAHDDEPSLPPTLRTVIDERRWCAVAQLARSSPKTTSVGRLLDACAAICGVRARITYEGQAAVEFEALARRATAEPYRTSVTDVEIDPRELVLAAEKDVVMGRAVSEIAAAVHSGLIHAAAQAVRRVAERTGLHTAVLSGGVFQNTLMVGGLSSLLARDGFRVLVPQLLPPNDGGISYGQAVVAAQRARA